MCFAGRVHAYEGWYPYETCFVSRMCALLGVKIFLLTNSAGGALPDMDPGSIMMIRDHMRFTNLDPMLDVCEDSRFGKRGMSGVGIYSSRLADIARKAAEKLEIKLHEGVYAWFPGPTYETHTEVQAGLSVGVGAFGMSTVPEALASHSIGMEVFAMSLATNMAAGLVDEELLHEDVTRIGREAGPKFAKLLLEIVRNFILFLFSLNTRNRSLTLSISTRPPPPSLSISLSLSLSISPPPPPPSLSISLSLSLSLYIYIYIYNVSSSYLLTSKLTHNTTL